MSALLAAGLRRRMPRKCDAEDEGRARHLGWRQMHGLPLLHDLLPLRYPEVRVFGLESENHEMQHVLRKAAAGKKARLCGILSGGRADVRAEKRTHGNCAASRIQPPGQVC